MFLFGLNYLLRALTSDHRLIYAHKITKLSIYLIYIIMETYYFFQ